MIQESLIYKEILKDIEELKPALLKAKASEESKIQSLIENLNQKLKDFTPKFMLYGCYNSGKSTLINALLGEECAKTGDSPETDKVTPYQHGDYIIYDTPGLNAPIEHEEVTKKHYEKCELVIFVMSNDNVDNEKAFKEIKTITDDKKPVLIVVNQKQEHNKEQKQEVEKQFYKNLEKIGYTEQDAENKIAVYTINALSALKGRVEHKQNLIESSGIIELESKINDLFKQSGVREVINVCNHNIKDFIDYVSKNIDNAFDNEALQEIADSITNISNQKRSASIECNSLLKEKLSSLQNSLIDELNKGNAKGAEGLYKSKVQEIEKELSKKLQTIAETIKKELKDLKGEYEKNFTGFEEAGDPLSKTEIATIATAISAAIALIPYPVTKIAAAVIEAIGMAIATIFGKDKEEEQKRIIMQNVNKARDIILKLEDAFTQAKDKVINELFDPVIAKLNEDSLLKKEHNITLQNLKAKISTILNKLPIV